MSLNITDYKWLDIHFRLWKEKDSALNGYEFLENLTWNDIIGFLPCMKSYKSDYEQKDGAHTIRQERGSTTPDEWFEKIKSELPAGYDIEGTMEMYAPGGRYMCDDGECLLSKLIWEFHYGNRSSS